MTECPRLNRPSQKSLRLRLAMNLTRSVLTLSRRRRPWSNRDAQCDHVGQLGTNLMDKSVFRFPTTHLVEHLREREHLGVLVEAVDLLLHGRRAALVLPVHHLHVRPARALGERRDEVLAWEKQVLSARGFKRVGKNTP